MSKDTSENKGGKILILCDYYLPGYKSGGGMRTIVNMVDRLNEKYKFFIITRDHDGKLDRQQYKTVEIDQWNNVNKAQVFYLSKDNISLSRLRELIVKVNPDVIYSNSYFSTLNIYLLLLRKLRRIPGINVILAPCGELSSGALRLNYLKKKSFITLARLSDLYKNIIWKASTILEKREIENFKGSTGEIFIAPDMLPLTIFKTYEQSLKPIKIIGEVKMIFLSRFMKKKNFKWLLENLSDIKGEVIIDIYGPLEDEDYWRECQKVIEKLPKNIKIEAKGSVEHQNVLDKLIKYHFFIMPTLGENFGHIFLESLAAGCPLIISDTTPWLDLEKKGIGWDLSLNKPAEWISKINYCIDLNQETYTELSINSRKYAIDILKDEKLLGSNLKVLERGLDLV